LRPEIRIEKIAVDGVPEILKAVLFDGSPQVLSQCQENALKLMVQYRTQELDQTRVSLLGGQTSPHRKRGSVSGRSIGGTRAR